MPGICNTPFISVICPPGSSGPVAEEFLDSQTADLVVTVNGGVIPAPHLDKVQVFQNGQLLIGSLQYSIAGSTISIDPLTHFDGSNYVVYLFV